MNKPISLPANELPIGAYLGWDWADKKHDLCLRLPGQKSGTHTVIKNTPEAIHGQLQHIRQQFPGQQVVLAIEASRSALLAIFEEYSEWLTLYEINPMAMAKYREVFHPSKVKSDGIDCALLADIVIAHPEQLHVHIPEDAQTLEIDTLNQDRRTLVNRRAALANELKSRLKLYFPQALDFIHEDTTLPFAAEFLLKWPCLEALQKAKIQSIREFYLVHRHRLTEALESRLAALPQAQAPTRKPCRIVPAVCFVQALAQELQTLHAIINDYDEQLAKRVAEHPTAPLLAELPGAGPVLRARLIGVLGLAASLQAEGQSRYKKAEDLSVITGVAPVKRSSGNSQVVLRRIAFSEFPHQTFIEHAKQSARYSSWAKAFLDYKLAQGWKYWRAIRALAFKWIRILVAVMRSGEAYDEAKYIKELLKKNCPYMKPDPTQT